MKSEVPPSETLILLDMPKASMSEKPLAEDLASLGLVPTIGSIALLSPDPLPHIDIPSDRISEDAGADVAVDSGDPKNRAALFGRYTGQIDARIERAWRRPRSPVNSRAAGLQVSRASTANGVPLDETFKCQVRIIQNEHGSVQEVQMLNCNGSAAWQQSLVSAILAVSPLPAPPNPSVFTKAVTMTFTGNPYTPQSIADEYEIEMTAAVRNADRQRNIAVFPYRRSANPAGILFMHPTQ